MRLDQDLIMSRPEKLKGLEMRDLEIEKLDALPLEHTAPLTNRTRPQLGVKVRRLDVRLRVLGELCVDRLQCGHRTQVHDFASPVS